MNKFEIADILLAAMDAETLLWELLRELSESDAQDGLRYIAQCWDITLDDVDED